MGVFDWETYNNNYLIMFLFYFIKMLYLRNIRLTACTLYGRMKKPQVMIIIFPVALIILSYPIYTWAICSHPTLLFSCRKRSPRSGNTIPSQRVRARRRVPNILEWYIFFPFKQHAVYGRKR